LLTPIAYPQIKTFPKWAYFEMFLYFAYPG